MYNEKMIPLHPLKAGCSSARLEYASGGRVVAGSNPVIPTEESIDNQMIVNAFCFIRSLLESCGLNTV